MIITSNYKVTGKSSCEMFGLLLYKSYTFTNDTIFEFVPFYSSEH